MRRVPDIDNTDLARALPLVEAGPLGEAVILHNRNSGAIVASNAFGAMLIDQLRATPDPVQVVRAVAEALELPRDDVRGAVQETLAKWGADGLFLTALRPFPLAVSYRPVKGGVTRRWSLGARTVIVHSEDGTLADDLDRALAPMGLAPEADIAAHPPVRLEVVLDDGGYGVFRDGAAIWGIAGYELTRFHLLREIMDGLFGPERVSAHLHASAMASKGAGLILAGASGSGKSTLATLLLGAGAALAADDHVALDTTGDAFLAFPTRPNLKPGTVELPQVRAVIAAEGVGAEGTGADGMGQGEFVPKARVPAGTEFRLAGLVFPRYAPDADNALTPLAPDEALRELIQTGSRVSRGTGSIAPLLKALDAHPTCRLSYRDTEFAIAECVALFESRARSGS